MMEENIIAYQGFIEANHYNDGKYQINKILLSDGYHNGGIESSALIERYGGLFDRCIGIGNASDYDVNFLSNLTKEELVNGANSVNQVMDYIVDSLFGPISRVANSVNHYLDTGYPYKSNIEMEDNHVLMEELFSYQLIYFTGHTPRDEIIYNLNYIRSSDRAEINNELSITLDDTASEEVIVKETDRMINLRTLIAELAGDSLDRLRELKINAEEARVKFMELVEVEKTMGEVEIIGMMVTYIDSYIESLRKLINSKESHNDMEYTVQHRNMLMSMSAARTPSANRHSSSNYSAPHTLRPRYPGVSPESHDSEPTIGISSTHSISRSPVLGTPSIGTPSIGTPRRYLTNPAEESPISSAIPSTLKPSESKSIFYEFKNFLKYF
jgi:hypothetical protein